MTFTLKSFPPIASIKYLKGAMLTVITRAPDSLEFRLHDIAANNVSSKNNFFIKLK
jgi:hypothetical protein